MGASKDIVRKQIDDLKNYTDTVAAVHLLKEVVTSGAVVTIGRAQEIIAIENKEKDPKIGNVVKAILQSAGNPGESTKWVKKDDEKQHLEAAITIGGAVYTIDLVFDGYDSVVDTTQNYTVNITSKLNSEVSRGKLFFDHDHTATVKLTYDKDGDLRAVTHKGLAVDTKSFVPYAYQNEILAKFHDSLKAGQEQRLAVMGTGSGKSIVMAGIAQAVGRTVMIVPDETLVKQQIKETTDLLSAGVVNGVKVAPRIFTLDSIKGKVDVLWDALKKDLSDIEEEDILKIKAYFRKVIAGTEPFDQLILQAEHPLFKIIASEISDSMVLIDESHKHTFKPEDTEILKGIQKNNTVLALTATPTSELYDLFKGAPLDDLSLGAAIELGTIRPIKPELAYLEEGDLVDQAVVHYFDDYYLEAGMMGYVDPVALKKQIIQAEIGIEDSVAQERAINQALVLNRIRCQRNMSFSDDKETREKLAGIYQKIANGDRETIEKYQGEVAKLRQKSECDARLQLAQKFGAVDEIEFRKTVVLPVVNLKQDIDTEQQKDIQRAINSFALALVFNEKQTDIAEKDRTHKFDNYLSEYDQHIVKYKKEVLPEPYATKLESCETKNRETLKEALEKLGVPISNLPAAQKEAITKLILDRAEAIVTKIKGSEPISEVIKGAPLPNLVTLQATENYSGAIDMSTNQTTKDEQIAQIEVGLRTHIVADQVIATGVSIRDILNVQIINTNSPVIESDINVINGILSGPQATGRCVRNKDTEARVQQYIDQRYEGKGLILTVHDVIDVKNSAVKAREVLESREKQAQKEAAVVRLLKTELKGFDAFTLFQQCVPLHDRIEGLVKKLDVLDNLLKDKEKSVVTYKLTRDRTEKQYESQKEYLERDITTLAKELEIIPGRKGKAPETRLPSEYARNASLYLMWVKITLKQATLNATTEKVRFTLEQINHEIEKLEDAIKEIQVTYEEGSLELQKLRVQEERMIQEIEEANKRFTSVQ
ncbi:DEAD/DEAH box helicase family protein [Legionella resiliens]|uniref:DEAD/DEAH box helicase family protein n=1 Tax=Legionella resiliens TaxID=2905958 RepID=A0ABS8X1J5_9GAMM|nr:MULTISPECIES: DEAD/DEAH box helicase family protein [unclassified Legionella]MCE0722694.1 DEAD/DEAH box helicase family protein [Legionella sp. 9fVS26]MCE3531847.1 DEAD/DEAH box helicase family protein [Legionella sp. 8cVS16]